MIRTLILPAVLMTAATTIALACVDQESKKEKPTVPAVLNFTMNSLDGKPVELSKYQGKVVLMVNVASQCGLTPQYKALEALHEKYKDKGLVILGFPANNFGQQEPGTDSEIKEFCSKNYDVKFDMFSKISVKGDDQCALYKHLTSTDTDPKFAGDIKWNFEKFLISRDGTIVNRFNPKITPEADEVTKAIEAELDAKPGESGKSDKPDKTQKSPPATAPATQPAGKH